MKSRTLLTFENVNIPMLELRSILSIKNEFQYLIMSNGSLLAHIKRVFLEHTSGITSKKFIDQYFDVSAQINLLCVQFECINTQYTW